MNLSVHYRHSLPGGVAYCMWLLRRNYQIPTDFIYDTIAYVLARERVSKLVLDTYAGLDTGSRYNVERLGLATYYILATLQMVGYVELRDPANGSTIECINLTHPRGGKLYAERRDPRDIEEIPPDSGTHDL